MPEATEPKQRTRVVKKKLYVVQKTHVDDDSWTDILDVDDTRAGQKWIADNGEDGESYRVVAVTFTATVKAETVTKRTLT